MKFRATFHTPQTLWQDCILELLVLYIFVFNYILIIMIYFMFLVLQVNNNESETNSGHNCNDRRNIKWWFYLYTLHLEYEEACNIQHGDPNLE